MKSQLEPWVQLGNKVVMVTGASSGIGREFCLDLSKSGCRIIAAARRIGLLETLCDEINRLPDSEGSTPNRLAPRAVAVELDVSAEGSVIEAAVQRAWDTFGTIDALINNAGVSGSAKSVLDSSEDEWNHILKTNLTGTWLVSKYVCLRMRDAKKGGSIINISSISGLNRGQLPGSVAYSSSKAAVNTLTKMMAIQLGTYNIKVNSICPGLFKSEITEGLMQKDWLTNVAQRTSPLRTFGTSNPALTSLVRYLIHDSSEYVSGNIFIVDAGSTLPVTKVNWDSLNDRSVQKGEISCALNSREPYGHKLDRACDILIGYPPKYRGYRGATRSVADIHAIPQAIPIVIVVQPPPANVEVGDESQEEGVEELFAAFDDLVAQGSETAYFWWADSA